MQEKSGVPNLAACENHGKQLKLKVMKKKKKKWVDAKKT